MNSKFKLTAQSAELGFILTVTLFGLSNAAAVFGFQSLSHILYWQGWGLQALVPSLNIGTSEKPIYEGTPLHVAAFFAGLPVGIVIYTVAVFIVLTFYRQRRLD
jgi:hypothetical protein